MIRYTNYTIAAPPMQKEPKNPALLSHSSNILLFILVKPQLDLEQIAVQ